MLSIVKLLHTSLLRLCCRIELQPLLAGQQYADTVAAAVIGFVVQSAACPAHHQKPVQILADTHYMSVPALSTAASVIGDDNSLLQYLYSLDILVYCGIRGGLEPGQRGANAQLQQSICTLLVGTHVAKAEQGDPKRVGAINCCCCYATRRRGLRCIDHLHQCLQSLCKCGLKYVSP